MTENAQKEKLNFECLCSDGSEVCHEIFETKQQLNAHITHGHKARLTDKNWRTTTEKATRPCTYVKLKDKLHKKAPHRQRITTQETKRVNYGNKVSGTLSVPVVITFDFSFTTPEISQEIIPQQIDLRARKEG